MLSGGVNPEDRTDNSLLETEKKLILSSENFGMDFIQE